VAISSSLGSTEQAGTDMTPYRASKAALNNTWAGFALALKGDGIVCLPLHPGWVKTDLGGPSAPVTTQDSVAGLRKRIAEAGPDDSGVFQDYAGKPLPW
jgi:NAD(P)-dependent dehydrogenase (short-subunit alcohol dehydrogenase family)